MDFQHLAGPRNVSVDLKYCISGVFSSNSAIFEHFADIGAFANFADTKITVSLLKGKGTGLIHE